MPKSDASKWLALFDYSAVDDRYCASVAARCRTSPRRRLITRPLSLEGVSQMVYILPERLPALVRPAFDLVLRRIRSLKRCVQA